MTGFGRSEGAVNDVVWNWELRAVNGKGLDIRLRLPNGYEQLEPVTRKKLSQSFSRGNIQASLTLDQSKSRQVPTLNQSALQSALQAVAEIERISNRAPSSAADILSIKGVFEPSEIELDPETQKKIHQSIMASLEGCIAALMESRATEGAALSKLLLDRVSRIEELANSAEEDASRTPEAIINRLKKQLDRLKSAEANIDPERLYQEAAILATKADIREELDRLFAHVKSARELIGQGSPVGRKLEFLAQEFNRESNTLCSKSNAVTLTAIGLELKVVIDQFREQILNVE